MLILATAWSYSDRMSRDKFCKFSGARKIRGNPGIEVSQKLRILFQGGRSGQKCQVLLNYQE